jgi:hypothetical protein
MNNKKIKILLEAKKKKTKTDVGIFFFILFN